MSRYKYKAVGEDGKPVESILEGTSADEVGRNLAAKGLTPIKIELESSMPDIFNLSIFSGITNSFKKIKPRELSVIFRQLAALFTAGVPLFDSLIALEEQFSGEEKIRRVVSDIKNEVAGGSTFSGALAKHPETFSGLIIAMVEAGERAGVMEEVLHRISIFLDKENQMRSKLTGALRYPLIVLSVMAVAFIAAVVFIIPKFSAIFSTFQTQLPLPTRMLLWINYTAVNYWWAILIALIVGYNVFNLYRKSPAGHYRVDQLLLKLPVFGQLVTKISLARFFTMLSSMISSGISIVDSLEITADTADNVVIAKTIADIRREVIGGTSLSVCMRKYPLFPPSAVHMAAIGEKSGSIDTMLMKSADYFNEETDFMIANLMSLLEPFLIFFVAVFVLILALGIFMPMWNVMNLYTQ